MQSENNIDIENIKRLHEIADIYQLTGQQNQSVKYHEKIIELCNMYPKSEEILILKIKSLNYLEKTYKSLETTKKLLDINPNNSIGLFNIVRYLKG